MNWKKLYQRIRYGRTFDERYEYTVIKCTSLESAERKHKYMLDAGWIQDGDVSAKYSSVSCWYKKPKMERYLDPDALTGKTGLQPIDHSKTREWKGIPVEPEDYEGMKFNPFAMDEIGPFSQLNTEFKPSVDPARAERWKMGPIQATPDWTEFKERNPELFNGKKLENEYLNKPFIGYRTVLTGEVFDGTLFAEGPDDSVTQYSLRDNTLPNGRYAIRGTVENRNIIHVTEYNLIEPQ